MQATPRARLLGSRRAPRAGEGRGPGGADTDGGPPALPMQTFAASPFSDPFQLDNPDPQPIVDGEEGLIWVIGPVLAVVFIICIVIAILLYKK